MVEMHRAPAAMAAPRARRRRYATDYFGDHRDDPYHWLRDPGYPQLNDSAILEHIEAENAYAHATIPEPLRARLRSELQARVPASDTTVPYRSRNYWYWSRFEPGAEYPLLCRARYQVGDEPDATALVDRCEVFLDLPQVAANYAYSHVSNVAFHPDEDLFCYSHDALGDERYRLRFRRSSSGSDYPFGIDHGEGVAFWSTTGDWLFYLELDEANRPRRLCRRRFSGDRLSEPVLVYEERDPSFWMQLSQSHDRRFLILSVSDKQTNEVLLLDCDAPETPPRVFFPRAECHHYLVQHGAHGFFILSNWHHQNFELFHLLECPALEPAPAEPHELLATYLSDATRILVGSDALLYQMQIFEHHWVVLETHQANSRVRIGRVGQAATRVIEAEEPAYSFTLENNDHFAATRLRVLYQGLRHPPQVLELCLNEPDEQRLLQVHAPRTPYDANEYVTECLWASSHDGMWVPISVIRHRSTPLTGEAPLYLYAYGSQGRAIHPQFDPHRLSLLERGFVYAVAHVRGGSALGGGWYADGQLQDKPNSFQDLIFCASHLIETGYTSAGRIVIASSSAGGMLVGNVINQAPELFAAAVAHVPFVDCLNTLLDASLTFTPHAYSEWGDPLTSERAYWRIREFSPYDNVVEQPYPAVFVTNGLHDRRVTYWGALKWVARLRERASNHPWVVVQTHHAAGHRGVSGRYRRLEDVALEYAFILQRFGMPEPTSASPRR